MPRLGGSVVDCEFVAHQRISAAAAQILIESRGRFLAFLLQRVGDRAAAEEILQEAFVRGIERGGSLRSEESAVAWFYRLLRNALADHQRRQGIARQTIQPHPTEPEADPDVELGRVVCACIHDLIPTLKPEYAEAVRQVDLGGASVTEYARVAGITANNASVRLHRARTALHERLIQSCGTCTEHGCLDCHCKDPKPRPSARA